MTDDDLDHVPGPTGPGVGDPAALAVASLVVGALSLGGFGMLNGAIYIVPFTEGQTSTVRLVLAGLLGAAFALAAVGLGIRAKNRAHPGDPEWIVRLAQAGILVSGIAVALRLVATLAAAAQGAEFGLFAPL